MLDCLKKFKYKKSGLFAAGVFFGTAGIKVLTSKDAKSLYANCTAAVLRAKDCVMKTATDIQENAEDIYEEAKAINAQRDLWDEFYDREDLVVSEDKDPEDGADDESDAEPSADTEE
ncbi:MAG: hypothetical protein IJ137_10280 [Eubacterium sp.]|nr:hypothetical protein [Eubacterium sp.]